MTSPNDASDLPVAEEPPEDQIRGMATDDDLDQPDSADEETD